MGAEGVEVGKRRRGWGADGMKRWLGCRREGSAGRVRRGWKTGWKAESVEWAGSAVLRAPPGTQWQENKRLGDTQATPLRLALAAARQSYPYNQRNNNQQTHWEKQHRKGGRRRVTDSQHV